MRDGTDLKETILHESQELFAAHGYAGTSIKQIATASSCTTAALYYYFSHGKAQILRAVVRASFWPEITMILQASRDAASLGEWVRAFGNAAIQNLHVIQRRQTWVEPELHLLGDDERAMFHQSMLDLQQHLAMEIARFVQEQSMANKLTWTLICAFSGYGKMFMGMRLKQASEFNPTAFVEIIAGIIGNAAD